MADKKPRIAYLSMIDPQDKRSWSGTTYYIGQALKNHVGDVDFLGPITIPAWLHKLLNAITKFNRVVFGKTYVTKYSGLLSRYMGRQFSKKLRQQPYDFIVAPAASTELSHCKTPAPVVYISDTTFKLISNYYKSDFNNLSGLSWREGNRAEKRSLRKSDLVIYSSQWAAQSAMSDYGIQASHIAVMPLGANMDYMPGRAMISEKEQNQVLTLLYLAVEWERKGGPIAFATLKQLQETGIKARLIVCGCIPPPQFSHPDMEVIPFLNKNKADEHDRFVQLLSSVHFLLLPTRADCSLLVACESNAYGVPAITTDTGGVSEVVKDGINGYCLPYEAGGAEYAALIADIFKDKQRYHQLVESSRDRFEEQLNWEKWAEKFKSLVAKHISPLSAQQ